MAIPQRQWKNLVKDIRRNRCVLMLGPRLSVGYREGKAEPLVELLAEQLSAELKMEGIGFEEKAVRDLFYIGQRFMTIPKIRRIDLEDESVAVLSKLTQEIPNYYLSLARLPFHLVMNTTPDNYMYRAFREVGKWNAHFLYYNFRKEMAPALPEISVDTPLVYNLLGSLDDPESLVLSQDDQVDFIKNVVRGNPPVPNQVMRHFDERKTYLFLGFNLERWEFRLLLDSLQLGGQNLTIAPQLDNYPVSAVTKSFYEDRYQFVFVEEKIGDFVRQLEEAFKETEALEVKNKDSRPVKVVILYDNNEADAAGCRALADHLNSWLRPGGGEVWHPGMVAFGAAEDRLTERLRDADLILPLLSVDFLASELIYEKYLPAALTSSAAVIPIHFRACHYADSTVAGLPVLPGNGEPVTSWNSEDEAFKHIVEKLKAMTDG